MYKIIQRLVFTLLLISCSEDEVIRKYPLISTLEVANITEDGATFQGNITSTGNQPILKYGFAWSETENPTLNNDENVILLATEGNDFEFHVKTTLKEQVTYYVRAFVQTEGFTVYGKNSSFISLGSGAPEIGSISPASVTYADTLYIKGKNFGKVATNNKVLLGESQAEVAFSSDTVIKAIVPVTISDSSLIVSVSIFGNKTIHNTAIKVKTPQITGFSKSESVIGDTISINGHFFGPSSHLNEILFNEVETTALETASNSITVIVPIVDSPISVSITNSVGQTGKSDDFELLKPVINSITPEDAFWGDTIEITGQNFGYVESIVKVYFNNSEANILDFSSDVIRAKVPEGVNNPIEVKVTTKNIESKSSSFYYLGPEIYSISPQNGTWGEVITIHGNNFSENIDEINLQVGDIDVDVLSLSKDEVTFKVPNELIKANSDIALISNNIEAELANSFNLNSPKILSLSSPSGTWNDEITIFANGFLLTPHSENIISMDGINCEVIDGSSTELTFRIPEGLTTKSSKVKLQCYGYNTFSSNFNLRIPSIMSISPQKVTKIGSEIIISGQNFHPIKENNKVSFNENLLEIVSASPTRLFAKLVETSVDYPLVSQKHVGPLEIDNGIGISSSQITLELETPWKVIDNFNFNSLGKWFTINKKGYLIKENRELHEFDLETETWKQLSSFPGVGGLDNKRYYSEGFALNNKIYYGLGIVTQKNNSGNPNLIPPPKRLNDFWVYSLETSEWNRLNDLNFATSNLEGASVNNQAYLLGQKAFQYVEENDTWVPISNPSSNSISAVKSFEHNNRLNIVYADRTLNEYKFSEYNEVLNEWVVYFSTNDISFINDVKMLNGDLYMMNLVVTDVNHIIPFFLTYINLYTSTFYKFSFDSNELLEIENADPENAIIPFQHKGFLYIDGIRSSSSFYKYNTNFD